MLFYEILNDPMCCPSSCYVRRFCVCKLYVVYISVRSRCKYIEDPDTVYATHTYAYVHYDTYCCTLQSIRQVAVTQRFTPAIVRELGPIATVTSDRESSLLCSFSYRGSIGRPPELEVSPIIHYTQEETSTYNVQQWRRSLQRRGRL